VELGGEGTLSAIGTDPVVVEFPVDDPNGDAGPEAAIRIPSEPGRLEVAEVGPPALAAGAVPGGQRRGLVQEEELGVPP